MTAQQHELPTTTRWAAAVVLSIDPASKSGAAIIHAGKVLHSATVKTAAHRWKILEAAEQHAAKRGIPLVVVMEKMTANRNPKKDKAATTNMLLKMGESRGRWLELLELRGYPSADIVYTLVQVWRGAVLKGWKLPRRDRKNLKAAVRQWVKMNTGLDLDEEQADATAQGLFAGQRIEVREMALRRRVDE